jgi:hypothetical protein
MTRRSAEVRACVLTAAYGDIWLPNSSSGRLTDSFRVLADSRASSRVLDSGLLGESADSTIHAVMTLRASVRSAARS